MDFTLANKGETDHFQLVENRIPTGNWIGIKLFGEKSNRGAIGAKTQLLDNLGRTHYKEKTCGHGWASQNSDVLYFGLGEATTIDSFRLYWPSGLVQDIDSVKLNQYYTITEGFSPVEGIVNKPRVVTSTQLKYLPSHFDFQIFPNPNHGLMTLNVSTKKSNSLLIEVFNRLGQRVYQTKVDPIPTGSTQIPLNLKGTNSRNFLIIRLSNDTYQATQKVVLVE